MDEYRHCSILPVSTTSGSHSSIALILSPSLSGNISLQLQDTSEICLPSLKVLHLLDMDYLDLNSVNMLLSGCPILENLKLCFCPKYLAKLQVPSSLKRLKVEGQYKVGTCLEIDAPGLRYLSLTKVILGDVVRNLHNVEEAYVDVFSTPESKSVEPLHNLLRALSGIKHLELTASTTECLFAAPVLDFPELHYLLHLKLWLFSFNATFLFDMLQKCPMLQTSYHSATRGTDHLIHHLHIDKRQSLRVFLNVSYPI